MKKIRIGVIGLGVMGNFHTQKLADIKEAKLVGVYDLDQARAQEIAEKYKIKAFSTIEELLANVDAVSLASPTSTHPALAIKCLEAGKHLFIEKPIANTLAEAETIVGLANKNNLIFGVGMIERFNPAFQKAASIIKKEKILGIEAVRHSPYPARISDASVAQDMMIHDLDLILTLGRTEVDSLKAKGRKTKSNKIDIALATVYFKDGMIAKVEANRDVPDKKRLLTVTTDHAIYEIDLLAKKLYRRDFNSLTDKTEIEVKDEDQLTQELRNFLASVQKNRLPMVDGQAGLKAQQLLEEVENKIC